MMYTDDKNAQIVLALLKKYGIRKIVISPGMTNVPISRSVQNDSFFEVHSVVDERSAAFFAGGLAFASNEPVVISCTGATSSRNYLPGLTEAFYRNLPVIALTSQHHSPDYSDLVPQLTDRTVSQNDVKRYAALLPVVKDNEDHKRCVFQINKALHFATTKGGGPVHINLPVTSFRFTTKKLPDITKIDYFDSESINSKSLSKELAGKKVGIFIGSHRPFDKETTDSISRFAKRTGAAVFYDHTSSYTGSNRVLTSQIADLIMTDNLPDIMIDIGSIHGDYSAPMLCKDIVTWRVSEDGEFHNRKGEQELRKVFYCSERLFFDSVSSSSATAKSRNYYGELAKVTAKITVPTMPLSNTYISSKLSRHIPKNSILHMGILNSLRNMDFYEIDKSIVSSCNVGGFGIDGPVSTLIGQSMADKNRLSFGLIGDLAFFYDMNALGIRSITNNVRILMVNNGSGVEFRLNDRLESQWGSDTNEFISAAGHNGSARAWAESRNFKYMSATTKEEYDDQIVEFCSEDINCFKQPVLFEVFTTISDEQEAIRRIRNVNRPISKQLKSAKAIEKNKKKLKPTPSKPTPVAKRVIKKVAPKKAIKAYRRVKGTN